MIDYRDGKARQYLGVVDIDSMEGDFSKAVEFIKAEEKKYKDSYIKKAGIVFGIYADSAKEKRTTSMFVEQDKRTYKFDRIYLTYETIYDYDYPNGKRELQIWGERKISAEEQKALNETNSLTKKEQERRDRLMLAALKEKLGEK